VVVMAMAMATMYYCICEGSDTHDVGILLYMLTD
jgi:hypothetical protein